ncbi:methyltransferase [Rathayibacter sp. AY1E4]|uniref:methyltransferase n=1 Tax=Rathayibacter sp. AY1E4 TaxID=2080552 RepID=UPI0011AFE719|nr:methyltransferase [Rathayibacter sp. AY1E4]
MAVTLPKSLERWLRAPAHEEVPAQWVPGLSVDERRALFAVGGVARGLLDFRTIASFPDKVQQWMNQAPTPSVEDLQSFKETIAATPDEAFASLYSAIVSREHRRQLGTFFTPSAEVKLMLDLWNETEASSPRTVIDVGAGVGVFTAEAASRWPDAKVIAVDINPVTLGLLAVRLFSTAASNHAAQLFEQVTLACVDYTSWFAGAEAPPKGGRLILGNPPYTRAQLLSLEERARLQELAGGLCGSRASLSTIITAQTLLNLGPTDGLSLLLPAQWLESQYARNLRKFIWGASRRHVELRLVESEDLFGGAQVDAVALVIGKEQPMLQSFRLARWRETKPTELDRTNEIPASWRRPFDEKMTGVPVFDSVPLSDLAVVKRGVATGSNATFILSGDKAMGLPKSALRRVITRLSEFKQAVTQEDIEAVSSRATGWLLTITKAQVEASPELRVLIEAAEAARIHEGLLCSRRMHWFDLTSEVQTPDVLVGAMTQNRFRLVENLIGATQTNNIYGLTWKPSLSESARSRTLEWLRSDDGQIALAGVARRQGAGLLKLEPGGLRALRVPTSIVE